MAWGRIKVVRDIDVVAGVAVGEWAEGSRCDGRASSAVWSRVLSAAALGDLDVGKEPSRSTWKVM